MPTNISPDQAKQMIQKYRTSAPKNSLNCALFNMDFANFIIANKEKLKISGVRAYLAQDDKGQNTIILAATTLVNGLEVDIKTGYYDYSLPCPTACGRGEI